MSLQLYISRGPVRFLPHYVRRRLAGHIVVLSMVLSGGALAYPPLEGGKTPTLSEAAAPPPVQSPPADEQTVAPSDSRPKVAPPRQTQADKPAPAAPETDLPKKLEPVAPSEAAAILGKKVKGPDGKDIVGAVVDILVDGQGRPRAALIDFGGYMGVGSRKIAVDWNLLTFRPDDAGTPITLGLDRAEIEAAPEYKDPTQPAEVVEAPTGAPSAPVTTPPPDNVEPHPN
jgi:hypothetical protein